MVTRSTTSRVTRPTTSAVTGNGVSGGSLNWGAPISVRSQLQDVTVFVNPSFSTINSASTVYITSKHNDYGLQVEATASGIANIWEGSVYDAWYGSENADTVNGIPAKTTVGGRNYWQIDADSEFVEWDFDGSISPTHVRVTVYRGGTNAVVEVVRNRGGELTTLGEADLQALSGIADVSVNISLSDDLVSGDKIRIRRQAGDPDRVRLQSIAAYDGSSSGNNHPLLMPSPEAIKDSVSSMEFAYRAAPEGQTTVFVGNVAHQAPTTESNRAITFALDASPWTIAKGTFVGTFAITRAADYNHNNGGTLFASFEITTSWTVSGLHGSHTLTAIESTDLSTFYPVMWPHDPTPIANYLHFNGTEISLPASGASSPSYGNSKQAQIATTASGRFIGVVVPQDYLGRIAEANDNKFYFEDESQNGVTLAPEETLEFSWDLIFGGIR